MKVTRWTCAEGDAGAEMWRDDEGAYVLHSDVAALEAVLNTPEVDTFDKGVTLEAAHQVIRWGTEHDSGKNPEDWFWLIGYLAGKALHAHRMGDLHKAKHHCISTAAVLRNWHSHIRSGESLMRPGIEEPKP